MYKINNKNGERSFVCFFFLSFIVFIVSFSSAAAVAVFFSEVCSRFFIYQVVLGLDISRIVMWSYRGIRGSCQVLTPVCVWRKYTCPCTVVRCSVLIENQGRCYIQHEIPRKTTNLDETIVWNIILKLCDWPYPSGRSGGWCPWGLFWGVCPWPLESCPLIRCAWRRFSWLGESSRQLPPPAAPVGSE